MISHIIELFTPSDLIGPKSEAYHRAAEGVWHVVLGGALALLLSAWIILPLYLLKELNDMRLGGGLSDSLEDMACVAIGVFTFASGAFPAVALVVGLLLFLTK